MDIARIEPHDLSKLVKTDLSFDLPESCIPGVIEALAAIAHHALIVEGDA